MIGGIIQAVRGLIQSEGKAIDKWNERSEEGYEEFDKNYKEASERRDADISQQKNVGKQQYVEEQQPQPVEEGSPTQESITKDSTTEGSFTIENKDKNEEDKEKEGMTLSDEEIKDVVSEDSDVDSEDSDGESGGNGFGTAKQVMSIVQGIRKDIAGVGQALQGKKSEPFGSNTYQAVAPVIKAKYSTKVSNKSGDNVPSDVCLKKFFYKDDDNSFHDSDILDAYKNLQTITFTYKPEATEIDPTQDTETVHVGLKAQDIEAQPELASAVKEDPESGYKMVDTREMTMQNAAAISEIAKMLEEIQQKINSLGG